MKCTSCGYESNMDYSVCPQCQVPAQPNPAAQKILCALKDSLFTVICILTSVSCLLSFSGGGVPVIEILLTVFLWLTYAQARKGIADAKHLRCVSGTVYANYVIVYVAAGILLVLGVIFSLAFGFLANDPDFLETLLSGVTDGDVASMIQAFAFIPSGVIMVIFALGAAAVIALNIFSTRYIHRFAQSVYKSIEAGTLALKYPKAAQIWLYIFGGCSAVGCLSSLADGGMTAFVSGAVSSATPIIAGLLIRKYLSDEAAEPIVSPEIFE